MAENTCTSTADEKMSIKADTMLSNVTFGEFSSWFAAEIARAVETITTTDRKTNKKQRKMNKKIDEYLAKFVDSDTKAHCEIRALKSEVSEIKDALKYTQNMKDSEG